MIPIRLSLSGFLSYCEPVDIDFTSFDLACISGPNGAGKSSLLDAITWALFGQARKRDDSLINTRSDQAEVILTFAYENNLYRVQRLKPRDKTTLLEFHLASPEDDPPPGTDDPDLTWKPLTERTLRETQARIESTLRLDYETFVNAAFFLQGKADQFTQQRPGDRKRILGSILGLEVWEQYRQRAGERRRVLQGEVDNLDGRLQEIENELGEEAERQARLEQLEADLTRLAQARGTAEASLENIKKVAATLAEQRRLVETLGRQVETAEAALSGLESRLAARQTERQTYSELVAQAAQIEGDYQAWQAARAELSHWDEVAGRFREQETQRRQPLTEIETARALLEAERNTLLENQSAHQEAQAEAPDLEAALSQAQTALAAAQAQLERRGGLEAELGEARDQKAQAVAENPRLKAEMEELKERIDQLQQTDGAVCPLCGQPLSPQERQSLISELSAQGKERGDRFRANKAWLEESGQRVHTLEVELAALVQADDEVRTLTREVDRLSTRQEAMAKAARDWEAGGAARLVEIQAGLAEESYAPEARARLAEIDAELKAIGYDAAEHDRIRQEETAGRAAETAFRELETARAALAPLEREIADLEDQAASQQASLKTQQAEHDQAAASLAAAESQAPDLAAAEQDLFQIQEEENRLRMEVGAARQKVLVLDDLKTRRSALLSEKEALAARIGRLKQLERAFGKDGVPALLIEQALPQIETKANEVLERLSAGGMTVRFITQAAYKDTKREDLKETLDIQISDSAGVRDYEMYSGGEAFRVNFAIRLALSEVLAQRAGARLQTLVIDEGFGSQDTAGRQRLIEAINLVRPDFAKILVITHIDELKDAFPSRLEVEKTERGSVVQLM